MDFAEDRGDCIRNDFIWFYPIITRWQDMDIYGHINNVTYYSYFDSVVNRYLIEEGGIDVHNSRVVPYVAASSCDYRMRLTYPTAIEAGIRIDKLGQSSVTWGVGIFRAGALDASAHGMLVQVFVDRDDHRPVDIPAQIRKALLKLLVQNDE